MTDTEFKMLLIALFVGFMVLEILTGSFFRNALSRARDWYVEVIGTVLLLAVTQPAIVLSAAYLGTKLFPENAGILSDLPIWAMVLMFIIFDDMVQYWWHRANHAFPWLYNFHRPHHSAAYMSVRLVYRNNIFYNVFMPSIWLSAFMIYLGLGAVYGPFLVVKLTIITAAHASFKWDSFLYKYKWLHPFTWVLERVISLPSTHRAHHGKYLSDGVTNYKGNYGNMLFFWDVLFGTAKITRKYPEDYGIEGLKEISWPQELMWPVFGAKNGVKAGDELIDHDAPN